MNRNVNEHEDEGELRRLQDLIRIGLPNSGDAKDLKTQIEASLNRLSMRESETLGDLDALRLLHLKAEFHYAYGTPEKGAAIIMKDVRALDLVKRLDEWPKFDRPRFRATENVKLLRQEIWVLMAFAFHGKFLSGQVREALALLLKIAKLINKELDDADQDRKPYGTKSRLNHFLGHCYRAQRNFPEAERRFLMAQEQAALRLDREMKTVSMDKRQQEYLFAVITSARILGTGLSWTALQQGRLTRARHMLYTARTLLYPTGQEALKLLVRYLIAIAERRSALPGSKEWDLAMSELNSCSQQCKEIQNRRGVRRCIAEVARAHLDHAAYKPAYRETGISMALMAIEELKHAGSELLDGRSEAYQADLLSVRVCMMREDYRGARAALQRAKDSERPGTGTPDGRLNLDSMDESKHYADHVEEATQIEIMEAAIDTAVGETPWEDLSERLNAALAKSKDLQDRVLQSECHLRYALAAAKMGKIVEAKIHLGHWQALAPFIANYYLRIIEKQVESELQKANAITITLHSSTRMDDAVEQFKAEYCGRMFARNGGNIEKTAKAIGKNRDTVTKHLRYKKL